jgi:hypothetical protein
MATGESGAGNGEVQKPLDFVSKPQRRQIRVAKSFCKLVDNR